jgi:hypothetical protein
MVRTLERAGHDDPAHRATLRQIKKFCTPCQKNSRSPGRLKFMLKDDIIFNYAFIVDVMYIDGSPVLHVVDEATPFLANVHISSLTEPHTEDDRSSLEARKRQRYPPGEPRDQLPREHRISSRYIPEVR